MAGNKKTTALCNPTGLPPLDAELRFPAEFDRYRDPYYANEFVARWVTAYNPKMRTGPVLPGLNFGVLSGWVLPELVAPSETGKPAVNAGYDGTDCGYDPSVLWHDCQEGLARLFGLEGMSWSALGSGGSDAIQATVEIARQVHRAARRTIVICSQCAHPNWQQMVGRVARIECDDKTLLPRDEVLRMALGAKGRSKPAAWVLTVQTNGVVELPSEENLDEAHKNGVLLIGDLCAATGPRLCGLPSQSPAAQAHNDILKLLPHLDMIVVDPAKFIGYTTLTGLFGRNNPRFPRMGEIAARLLHLDGHPSFSARRGYFGGSGVNMASLLYLKHFAEKHGWLTARYVAEETTLIAEQIADALRTSARFKEPQASIFPDPDYCYRGQFEVLPVRSNSIPLVFPDADARNRAQDVLRNSLSRNHGFPGIAAAPFEIRTSSAAGARYGLRITIPPDAIRSPQDMRSLLEVFCQCLAVDTGPGGPSLFGQPSPKSMVVGFDHAAALGASEDSPDRTLPKPIQGAISRIWAFAAEYQRGEALALASALRRLARARQGPPSESAAELDRALVDLHDAAKFVWTESGRRPWLLSELKEFFLKRFDARHQVMDLTSPIQKAQHLQRALLGLYQELCRAAFDLKLGLPLQTREAMAEAVWYANQLASLPAGANRWYGHLPPRPSFTAKREEASGISGKLWHWCRLWLEM